MGIKDKLMAKVDKLLERFRKYQPELVVDDETGDIVAVVLTIPVKDAVELFDDDNSGGYARAGND